ncbi:sec-independent protein translocase protein TatA [Geodermatophilus normandii]|uniref:Sec-independent protein translocase protein TatA n=1 Tax=Geodermatophilus normandii TaxID=1137989 RepID=A0A317QN87_9ACTN|nr:Sec-independent protein translocase subunit TatA [Geodermatophilus normandii]PWW24297.1 sec-independent protein translocase protein TatA [Geodermatophilus normandii]
MNIGAPEIILIILAVLLLFGYKKLPDASRSFGRSLRIFKGEMKGMKDDDARAATPAPPAVLQAADADRRAQLEAEAAAAEARAAELRARAAQPGAADAR